MNTDALTILRQTVSNRLSTVDFLISIAADAVQLIALAGERLDILAALDILDARLGEGGDDEATPTA